jgi:hypothetical protein
LRLPAETFGVSERGVARASNDLRFEIYSTDESGNLNKSLKFWADGDFFRKLVFVFGRDKQAEGRILDM